MKKLIIVALGVCILGTACSRDNNLAEKNTLQQPLEQSVMLQTEEIEIQSTKESSSEQEIILLSEEPAETVSLKEIVQKPMHFIKMTRQIIHLRLHLKIHMR